MITLFNYFILFKNSPGRHAVIFFGHPVELQGTVGNDQVDNLLGIKKMVPGELFFSWIKSGETKAIANHSSI
jgi:hypothetical protein